MAEVCSIDDLMAARHKPAEEPPPPLRLSVEQQEAYARGMADAYRNVLEMMERNELRRADGHTKSGDVPAAIRGCEDPRT